MKRLLKRLCILFLCVSFTQLAFSQTKVITGTITDDKGAPVQGASIAVKGAKGGTTTDAAGAFTLTVPESAKSVIISSVGFNQQEIDITGKSVISTALVSSAQSLNDVVVIGYGTTRRKDLTGAITTVTSKDFNKGVIVSPEQLMQNKVSGLEVTANSGQPGAAMTVRIRGNSSIRGVGNPLYVIDGVILDGGNARPEISNSFGTTPDGNSLLWIDPNNIQDITVLKDAAATAIYGSRGANGVVVYTTKKGSAGPVKLEVNASVGVNTGYMHKFDILDQPTFITALHKYNSDSLANAFNKGANVDPLEDITQHSAIQNYDVALSGGSDAGKYRASFLASSTPGFLAGNKLNKYIASFYGGYKFLDKKLSVDFNVITGYDVEHIAPISNDAGSTGNIISSALQWNPTAAYYTSDGHFTNLGNSTPNPLALLKATSDIAEVVTVLASGSVAYNILPNLQYKFLYSINQSNGVRNYNLDGFEPVIANNTGFAQIAHADLTSQVYDNTLQYNTTFAQDLKFSALGGFEYWKSNFGVSGVGANTFNFNNNETQLVNTLYTDLISNGKVQNGGYSFRSITTEVQSYFGRVEFNLRDKYDLSATIRADGSSKFGENNKYGYFPSVGARWNIANEEFMHENHIINGLSLRATWGITGSQDFPAGASIDQYTFGSYNSAAQINAGNPDLKWEQTDQWDIGMDFSLFNSRLYGVFDYYNKDKTNILFQNIAIQPGPSAFYWINLPGHLINKGIEITLGGTIIQSKDWNWDLSVNFATNDNLITDFYAPGTKTPIAIPTGVLNGQGTSDTRSQIITNNQPVDEWYLKQFGGFAQNGAQIVPTTPVLYSGNPNPTKLYGFSTTVRYKKFALVINGGGSSGFLIYNNTATSVTNIGGIIQQRNIDKKAYNSPEDPHTTTAAASNRFLESGDYLKVRNATLSYSIGNIGNSLKNFNVYVSGSNLLNLTSFSGFDPEVNINKQFNGYPSSSIEYIPYPTARSVTFGISFAL